MLSHRPRRVRVPTGVFERLATRVEAAHPEETGGFLVCDRRGETLYVTDHVPVENEATDPRRRFVATVERSTPPTPRVFYHSHTSASSPSGLTATDRANIVDRFALVVFAPRGTPHSYRLFRRGLLDWRELPVERDGPGGERLPRLV